jgi:hypothetical protein
VEEVARVVVLVSCVLLVEVDWAKVLLLLLTSVAEALVEVAQVEEVEVLACWVVEEVARVVVLVNCVLLVEVD